MPIHAQRNLYPGINAHLNSFLQQEDGGWESFHAEYITGLRRALDRLLPSNYYAVAEKSLQVSEAGEEIELRRRTRPDISIFQLRSEPVSKTAAANAPTATLTLSAVLDDEEDYLSGIVIYEFEPSRLPGKPITRIEVLSPANKPQGRYYWQYLAKRKETLRSGVSLVEVDFLHETQPLLSELPSYPDREEDAYPYTILISDPRPNLAKGHLDIYGISVDARLPVVAVPLAEADIIALDFGAVYDDLVASSRVFTLLVDYAADPPNFDRYTPDDQQRIRALLAPIRQQQPNE